MAEQVQLTILLAGREVQVLSFGPGIYTLGRAPDSAIPLPHPQVARRHAELRLGSEQALIVDLASPSGTKLNGEQLSADQPYQLADGATIQIGPFSLLIRTASAKGAEASSDEPPVSSALPSAMPILSTPLPIAPPRKRYPIGRIGGPSSRYLLDLPDIYQSNEFLGRFLLIFEQIWEPLEQRQDHIDMYFDPRTCPSEILPWLASWLGLPLSIDLPEPRQRLILANAFDLQRWSGTHYGLTRAIELYTGLAVDIQEDEQPFVIRIRVAVDENQAIDNTTLVAVINEHKPAHVGYVLEFVRPG